MKKRRELMHIYPYEYKALEGYLQKQAKKGWMIESIYGNHMLTMIRYVACEPSDVYFYTDFTSENSMLMETLESRRTKEYREFTESYGFTYVTGFKELLVYRSDQHIDMQIREDNKETHRELRKATIKNIISHLLLGIMWAYIFFGNLRMDADSLSSNTHIMIICMSGLFVTLFLGMSLPALLWIIHPHSKHRIWKMKLRMDLIAFGAVLLFAVLLAGVHNVLCMLIIGIIVVVLIANRIFVYARALGKRAKIIIVCFSILIIFIGCYASTQIRILSPAMVPSDPISNHSAPIDITHIDKKVKGDVSVVSNSSILMTYEQVRYTYKNHQTLYYDVMYIKNSPVKQILLEHLPYYDDDVKVKQRGEYMIFNNRFETYVMNEHIILALEHDVYQKLSDQQLDRIFQELVASEKFRSL